MYIAIGRFSYPFWLSDKGWKFVSNYFELSHAADRMIDELEKVRFYAVIKDIWAYVTFSNLQELKDARFMLVDV